MASCRSSSEIEGAKNRLSPVQQISRIPVRIVNRLNINSGKSSSSKDEINMKQRILRNRLEKSQNKLPSRIPIPIGRMNRKDVGKDKISKTEKTPTGKRPLGTISGLNPPQTCGKQSASINDGTAKGLTATKHSSPEHVAEPTLPVTRGTPMEQVTLLDTEQTSTEEKIAGTENTKVQDDSVQPTDLVSACKANQIKPEDNVKTDDKPRGVFSTSCEEDHKKELDQIEKEHSEIVEELQQWVEDGDKKNKMLEEIIETTNEENMRLLAQISAMEKEFNALESENRTLQTQLEAKRVDAKTMLESHREVSTSCDEKHEKELAKLEKEHSEIEQELQQWVEDGNKKIKDLEEIIETTNEENVQLLVQISVMKKELKALEKENNTLQTELKTKRTDVKNLRAKEHYNERELRNLKRDLKRKEQSLETALAEKQALLDDTDYLEGILRDSRACNEQLNVQINELKDMVKEVNKRPDYGHLREEVELLKGSLDLCLHREELLSIQVDALTAEASHFKSCERRDEASDLVEQFEGQLELCKKENARIISEKEKELNELKDAKSKVIDDLNDQLATLTIESARKILEKEKELNELIDEKSRFIDRLEDQLTQSENRNATMVSEKNKELNELNKQHSRDDIQLRDQLAMLMEDHARIVSANDKMINQLEEKSRVIEALEDQLGKLKNENARVILDTNIEKMELNNKNSRVIDQLEEHLAKLMRENSSLTSEHPKTSNNDKKMTELQERVEKLREQKNLILSELDMMYHCLNYNDIVIEKLMKDLEQEMLEKDALSSALEFSLDNCATKEKAHARETRNLKYQLQEMSFLLNITDSCSDANDSKGQICECREKFFAM